MSSSSGPSSLFIPKVHAETQEEEEEVELVDPQETLRNECAATSHCKEFKNRLDECEVRVSSRKRTTEVCHEEVVDFVNCVDHCVAPKLFRFLK